MAELVEIPISQNHYMHRHTIIASPSKDDNMKLAFASLLFALFIRPSKSQTVAWINEFHSNNFMTDTGEFIEIGHIGDVTGFQVVLYQTTTVVPTIFSTSTIPLSTFDPFGTSYTVIEYPTNGIPDGFLAPAGIALVDPDGTLVEFLSYGGSFSIQVGPAKFVKSVNIGVSESDFDIPGLSLQKCPDTSVWIGPLSHTKGAANANCAPVETPVVAPVIAPVTEPITAPVPSPIAVPALAPLLAPVTVPLTPLTAPILPPVIAPVTALLTPLTAPVIAPIIAPVTAPLSPLTTPVLPPVIAPVTAPLTPLTAPVTPPVLTPAKVPVTVLPPVISPILPPLSFPTASLEPNPCGLFRLQIFCPFTGCGILGRLLGICRQSPLI